MIRKKKRGDNTKQYYHNSTAVGHTIQWLFGKKIWKMNSGKMNSDENVQCRQVEIFFDMDWFFKIIMIELC